MNIVHLIYQNWNNTQLGNNAGWGNPWGLLLGQPPGNGVVVGLAGNPKRKGWGFLLGE